jgi:DNA-binding NtrC family response regulator
MRRMTFPRHAAAMRETEANYFRALIQQSGGNMRRAAEIAGLNRTHMYARMKRAGVKPCLRSRGD